MLISVKDNNTYICIVPYGHNFRGAVARECASKSEKREESKPERKAMSLPRFKNGNRVAINHCLQ